MLIDEIRLDLLREAFRAGRGAEVSKAPVENFSLGAVLEFACWATASSEGISALTRHWRSRFAPIDQACENLLAGQAAPVAEDFPDGRRFELRRCPTRLELVDEANGIAWIGFQDRFRSALVERLSISRQLARGIAASLYEMADNVIQHANEGDAPRALVAYEVDPPRFGFAVADIGRGILASLRENPAHSEISTDVAALRAAVLNCASRRTDAPGAGFADLRRALADLAGEISFRSGSARLRLDGRAPGPRQETISSGPPMPGFQLSVEATPRNAHW